MYPEVFGLSFLHTYGVLVAAAFLSALWLAGKLAREANLSVDSVTNLGIYCALAAIAGAKLMMFLIDIPYYAQHPADIFSLSTLQAGGVFYGGLLGPSESPCGTCAKPACQVGKLPISSRLPLRWGTESAGWAASPRVAAGESSAAGPGP